MAFQGDLRNIGLATVFQNLQQNVQSGTLKVERNEKVRYVYVKEGKIAMFSSGAGSETPLGEFLIRAGKITHEELDEVQAKRRKGSRLGGALERAGKVESADVDAAIKAHIEEELYDLFTWTDGAFVFEDGVPSEDIFDVDMRNSKIALDPNGIILEAARRMDEWERINRVVGSLGDIYVVKRERQADLDGMTDVRVRRVSEFLDGKRDVAAVIRDSALGRFAVCNALSRLVSERMVRPISADELRQLAEQAELNSDIDEAMRLMRRALDLERNDIALRKKLAGLLDRAGEKQEAATEYKLLANSFMDAGRTNDAVDALRKAIDLMPSDVTTRERLFQLLSESGGKTVALETGIGLASTYTSLGLNEKTRLALERVLALNPKDRASVERKLVDAHLSLGDVKAAMEQLRKMAKRAMKARDYDEAGERYEELLKLDSKDEEARKRVAEIQAGVVERMIERRRRNVRLAIVALIALPVVAVVVRELAAHPAEHEMRLATLRRGIAAVRQLETARAVEVKGGSGEAGRAFVQAAEGFEACVKQIGEFRSAWGWTFASRAAGEEAREWQALAAESWMAAAHSHEAAARFDDAYDVYKRVHRSPGVPADVAEQAGKNAKRLEKVISKENRRRR